MTDIIHPHAALTERQSFGSYTAVKGKLHTGDNRGAYVLGPDVTGRICPVSSHWFYEEAVQWAKARHEEQQAKQKEQEHK